MTLPQYHNEPLLDFSSEENSRAMQAAIATVEGQFGKEYPLIIDGERVRTDKTLTSVNPSNRKQVIGVCHVAGQGEVDRAVAAATRAFATWRTVPPQDKAALFLRAGEILRRRRFEAAAWEVLEVGKTWGEADAEIAEAIDHFEFFAREILRYAEPQRLYPFPTELNELRYIPLGVVACITPWNYPFGIGMGMTLGAIAAGNTAILKPAEDASVLGTIYYEIMEEAGLPPGVLNIVTGRGAEAGDALVTHPDVRLVGFTGSKDTGIRIYERAARVSPGQIWLKRVIAEMGGKNAAIIDNDADLDYAVNEIAFAGYGYQGQKCSCTSRVIALPDVYDAVIERLAARTNALDIGPAKDNRFMGPMINQVAFDKVNEYFQIGAREGRTVVAGGPLSGNAYDHGYYVSPAVFADVDPKARIAQEEIFGPVIAVMRARNFDDALHIANDTVYGLTGSLFSRNPVNMAKADADFHVGNLYMNRRSTGAWIGAHPFGGYNMSGTAVKLGGPEYLAAFMQPKLVTRRVR